MSPPCLCPTSGNQHSVSVSKNSLSFQGWTCKWGHVICLCLAYFIRHNAPKAHLCCCKWQDLLFYGRIIFHCVCVYHLSVDKHLHCFHVLAVVNNAAMNIGVHVFFWINVFIFFREIPRSGIAGPYTSFIFNFWGNSILFHSGCTSLHLHQQYTRIPFLCILTNICYFFVFFIIVTLVFDVWCLMITHGGFD